MESPQEPGGKGLPAAAAAGPPAASDEPRQATAAAAAAAAADPPPAAPAAREPSPASAPSPPAAASAAGESAAAEPAAAAAAAAAGAGAKRKGNELSPEELLAVKEDRFLQAALRIRVDAGVFPNSVYLPKTAEELRKAGGPLRLRVDFVPEALIELTQIIFLDKSLNVFRADAEAFHRLSDETYTKYLPAEGRAAAAAAVQQQLVNHSVLLLTCLELFELEDPPPVAEISHQFRLFLEGGSPSLFMSKLVNGLKETEGDSAIAKAFGPAIDGLVEDIKGRGFADFKTPSVAALRFLSTFKPIASLMTLRPCFFPPFSPPFPSSFPGFFLQENSFLGRLLSFSPLDGPVLPKGQPNSTLRSFFVGSSLTPAQLQNAVQTIRQDIQSLMDIDNQILKNLCRAGLAERQRVVHWFAAVLGSNEGRARAAHLLLQQNSPESADPLHAFLLKAQGQNSFGFCCNVFHALLLLVEPIKVEKINEVSPFYATCGRSSDRTRTAVAGPLRREALLGEGETAAAAKRFYKAVAAAADADAAPKFSTEVFWLALRAVRLCFNPCASEFIRYMEYHQHNHHRGMQQPTQEAKHIAAEVLGWRAILLHPRLSTLYFHFIHLFSSWLLGCMFTFKEDGQANEEAIRLLAANRGKYAALLTQLPPGGPETPAKPPPQFALLPSGILEDIFLSLRHVADLHSVYLGLRGHGIDQSPLLPADFELIAALCVAVMGSPAFFRSVHTRCDGACRTLHRLFMIEEYRDRFLSVSSFRLFLIPSLVEVFIDSERGSYYDRINFRIPIVDMLTRLFYFQNYKNAIKTLAAEKPEKFLHLIHLLLNDVAALVDQAMEALVEIRKRQLEGRDNAEAPVPGQSRPAAAAAGGGGPTAAGSAAAGGPAAAAAAAAAAAGAAGEPEATEDSDGEMLDSLEGRSSLSRESWERLQGTARDLCALGHSACSLFTLFCKFCGSSISSSSSVLPQAVTTLDCCLDHLVGPSCLQLKVNAMESYNFRPKDWLSKVLEAFVYLLQADKTKGEALSNEMLRDGRYYKHANIAKACRIARREALIVPTLLDEFSGLVKRLAEAEQTERELDLDDAPAEYLDPIMADLITDPVLLPTSNVIMDRRNIERHLMSDPSDPFNRAPLTMEQLIPQPELKKEIEAFIEAKKAAAARTSAGQPASQENT